MTREDQHAGRKFLRTIAGNTADCDALAKDCECFANDAKTLLPRLMMGEVAVRRIAA